MNDASRFAQLIAAFDSTDNLNVWQTKCDEVIAFSLREFLADYIEAQKWDVANYQVVHNQFLDHAERKINDSTEQRRTLLKDLKSLQKKYNDRGEAFVAAMNDLMATEQHWIEKNLEKSTRIRINELTVEFSQLRNTCNMMLPPLVEKIPIVLCAVRSAEDADAKQELKKIVETLYKNCFDTSTTVTEYVNEILSSGGYLCSWRQWKNYPAARKDCGDLNEFQCMFSEAFFCLRDYDNLCTDLREMITGDIGKHFHALALTFQKLREQLIEKAFVVEENPPHTMKIERTKSEGRADEHLKLVVRCLLPFVWSNAKPEISVKYLSGEKAKLKLSGDKTFTMQVAPGNSQERPNRFVYESLKLASAKQSEQLYYFAFNISIDQYKAEVHSTPFGFYTHTSQIPRLSGRVLWHNAFTPVVDPCTTNRNEPHEVSWGEMARVLNYEFHSEDSVIANCIRTRGGARPQDSTEHFNDKNVRCLADVLRIQNEDISIVTRETFLKEPRVKSNTFWEWFFACYKTKHEKLPNVYAKKLLYGFISKGDAEQLLGRTNDDSVLLRFSTQYIDKACGFITPSTKSDHGKPMKAESYQEGNLGRCIIEKEFGLIDGSNLWIMTRNDRLEPFVTAFQEFMQTVDDFAGYQHLGQHTFETPNPSTPSSSLVASLSIPQSPPGTASNPSTPQSQFLDFESWALLTPQIFDDSVVQTTFTEQDVIVEPIEAAVCSQDMAPTFTFENSFLLDCETSMNVQYD